MRLVRTLATVFLSLFAALAAASPYPRDDLRDLGFGYLMERECSEYCGGDNELCCTEREACQTSDGVAACTQVEYIEARQVYTTTWTETRTYTSTISSWNGPTTTILGGSNGEDCVPPPGSGQIACGPICCANWQYCAASGQCAPNAGVGTWTEWTTVGIYTTQFSAPYRVTSGSTIVETQPPTETAASATATTTNTGAPVPITTTAGGLSPGAIAGIVVGTIVGVALLLLLCFCCIARGLWSVFAGIFGKKRKTERVEITEEHYHGSHHGAAATVRPAHRTWFGGGGGRPSTAASRKEKKSGGGLGWLVAGAGAVALLLGLRRDNKKRKASSHKPSRSDWSSSYYTDSYTASSPSSFSSSDRRSRGTRHSRSSRHSRHSRGTRASRVSRPSRI